ncbi:MAG: FKBP-type peptidyl-prolyl cis-trans isomerase [Deltaproteobacteria bacterium]|nr:FKBP-type peptidyl-prolyl cis-trans isomerase [Deltaproteobacteria bacterium]
MRARWLVATCFVAVLHTVACEDKVPEPSSAPAKAPSAKPEDPGPKELQKEDLKKGTGPEAKKGDKVTVHYTGRLLKTNAKFDSSVGKDPLPFTIGKGDVIKGWDQGVPGMLVGGKRKLTIPADLAYGKKGSPPKIPPNAALVFEIELLGVEGKSGADETGDDDAKPAGSGASKAKPKPAVSAAPKAPPSK